MERSVVFAFLFQIYRSHAMELSIFGHVISKHYWGGTFGFTEIINNFKLKRETVSQIVRFISHFSLKLYKQF